MKCRITRHFISTLLGVSLTQRVKYNKSSMDHDQAGVFHRLDLGPDYLKG